MPILSLVLVVALSVALVHDGSLQEPPAEALQPVRAALAANAADDAVRAALLLTEAYPDSLEALTLLGHALRLAQQPGSAARAYSRVLDRAPDDVATILGLAELQLQAGDFEAAAGGFSRALQLQPDNAAAHRSAGEALMQRSQHARAAEHFLAYLQADPASGDVIYLAGVSLYLAGELDRAIAVLQDGLGREPDAVPLEYALGVVFADRPADHSRAIELLAAAEQGAWEVADAAYLQGRILSDRGDHAGAVDALQRSLAVDPDKLDANYRLAQSLARLGARDEARAAMERFNRLQQAFNAAEYRDKQLGALDNELTAAIRAGDRASADAIARELLREAPDDPAVLVRAAKVWMSLGDVPSAHDAIVAATQIAPQNWEARYLEGLLLLGLERPAEAIVALETSRRARPMFADTYNLLGNALILVGRAEQAAEAYLAAAELEPDNSGYWLNLAAAYRAARRPDLEAAALREYRRRQ